jgi:hypothetical protein
MIVWPRSLQPRDVAIDPIPRTLGGPPALSGVVQVTASDKGLWRISFDRIPIYGAALVRAWRAIAARVGGRANAILLPVFDDERRPALATAEDATFSDDTSFSDLMEFEQNSFDVHLAADAALRATHITLAGLHAAQVEEGHVFSIGSRLHTIETISPIASAATAARDAFTVGRALPSTDDDSHTRFWASGLAFDAEQMQGQIIRFDSHAVPPSGIGNVDHLARIVAVQRDGALVQIEIDTVLPEAFAAGDGLSVLAATFAAAIWPSLRAAASAGAQLDFANPVLQVKLATDTELTLSLSNNENGFCSPVFIEDFS